MTARTHIPNETREPLTPGLPRLVRSGCHDLGAGRQRYPRESHRTRRLFGVSPLLSQRRALVDDPTDILSEHSQLTIPQGIRLRSRSLCTLYDVRRWARVDLQSGRAYLIFQRGFLCRSARIRSDRGFSRGRSQESSFLGRLDRWPSPRFAPHVAPSGSGSFPSHLLIVAVRSAIGSSSIPGEPIAPTPPISTITRTTRSAASTCESGHPGERQRRRSTTATKPLGRPRLDRPSLATALNCPQHFMPWRLSPRRDWSPPRQPRPGFFTGEMTCP